MFDTFTQKFPRDYTAAYTKTGLIKLILPYIYVELMAGALIVVRSILRYISSMHQTTIDPM